MWIHGQRLVVENVSLRERLESTDGSMEALEAVVPGLLSAILVARLHVEGKGGTVVCYAIRGEGVKVVAMADRFDLSAIVRINPLDRI